MKSINNNKKIDNICNDELIKAYIGKNYEKITKKKFNFAGFFLNTFYMSYRKMTGFAMLMLLIFLISWVVLSNLIGGEVDVIIFLLFYLFCGLFVNKIYLSKVNKKIEKIKVTNFGLSNDELKDICSKKGGTSVLYIFLCLLYQVLISLVAIIVIAIIDVSSFYGDFVKFFDIKSLFDGDIIIGEVVKVTDEDIENAILIEDVKLISERASGTEEDKCYYLCLVSLDDVYYAVNTDNNEYFYNLSAYEDFIKVNIYYIEKKNEKFIVKYNVYLKSTGEDITSIKAIDDLRIKLGLYITGEHTDTLTLKNSEKSSIYDTESGVETFYQTLIFTDKNGIEYVMNYYYEGEPLKLNEGEKYIVTFDVVDGTFGYEYTAKEIK